eukprot:1324081-Pyramimonas_sp.AAC.1
MAAPAGAPAGRGPKQRRPPRARAARAKGATEAADPRGAHHWMMEGLKKEREKRDRAQVVN